MHTTARLVSFAAALLMGTMVVCWSPSLLARPTEQLKARPGQNANQEAALPRISTAHPEVRRRDKRGTNGYGPETTNPQGIAVQHLADSQSLEAEDMGFEPTTHCWASDFESDRWPVRLSSSDIGKFTTLVP